MKDLKLRKILFWFHLVAGIAAGVVIMTMSITGVLLTYEKQITSWMDRNLRSEPAPPDAAAPRLPLQLLLSIAGEAAAGKPASVTFYADSSAAVISTSGPTLYVNAYDGRVLGIGSTNTRVFFRKVTDWHRYIALSGDRRPVGKLVTGAANLVFLFIVVSGAYLWLRGAVTWFRNGIRGKARYWNWHNVFGIWSCVPLFLVVLSATVISFPWASNLVFRLAGSEPPDAGRQRNRDAAILSTTDLSKADFAIAHAALQIPDWKTIALRLQASRDGAVSLAVDRGNAGQPQLRSTLTVGRSDEEKILVETFEEQSAGSRARSWLRFVHTGEYYGIAGQTIAGIASFAAIMLVWTGFALSWNRLNVWHSRRKQGSVAVDPMDSGR